MTSTDHQPWARLPLHLTCRIKSRTYTQGEGRGRRATDPRRLRDGAP